MIYLSQLILNPASRMVQNELRNPNELHRTLMRGYACKREDANVLHRLEVDPYSGVIALLVQSTEKPEWQPLTQVGQGNYLQFPPNWKTVDLNLQTDQILQFRLRANPTKRFSSGKGNKPGKRVQLFKEADQLAWLQRKAEPNGFRLLDANINPEGNQTDYRKKLTIYTVLINGRLQITNLEKFNTALHKGIGPAKAFGCGLLSLAPA